MTDEIARLRELLAKATAGQWEWEDYVADGKRSSLLVGKDYSVLRHAAHWTMTEADRELITAAVNALPALLDRLEAAERPEPCDCCDGSGKPISGKPCICEGYGTSGWERIGLRNVVFDLEEKLEAAERRVKELEGAARPILRLLSPRQGEEKWQAARDKLAAALRGEEATDE